MPATQRGLEEGRLVFVAEVSARTDVRYARPQQKAALAVVSVAGRRNVVVGGQVAVEVGVLGGAAVAVATAGVVEAAVVAETGTGTEATDGQRYRRESG